MAILKVIEILSDSDKSWEDATQHAVRSAAKTLKNIKSVYVEDFSATVDDNGNVVKYRVNVKITFEVYK